MKRALKNTKNTPIQSVSLWNFDGQSPITLTGVAFYTTTLPDCVKIICNTTPKNLIPYLIISTHSTLLTTAIVHHSVCSKVQFFSLERKCLRCSRFAENGPRDKKCFSYLKKKNKNTYKLLLRHFLVWMWGQNYIVKMLARGSSTSVSTKSTATSNPSF